MFMRAVSDLFGSDTVGGTSMSMVKIMTESLNMLIESCPADHYSAMIYLGGVIIGMRHERNAPDRVALVELDLLKRHVLRMKREGSETNAETK
jgi:hypothetical protein